MNYRCNILLGRITKASGYEGAVTVKLERSFIENIPQTESVFIEIDGRPVPFFIAESDYRGSDILRLKFIDYNTEARVHGLLGCRIYLTSGDPDKNTDDLNELTGYVVLNEDKVSLGEIRGIIENPGQMLIKIVSPDNKEILIPLHEDLILDINKEGKILEMKIPEGLTDLN